MRRSYAGSENPNFRNAGWHSCKTCAKEFHSYNKARQFCSLTCRSRSPEQLARAVAQLPVALAVKAQIAADAAAVIRGCAKCGATVDGTRTYCAGCVSESLRRRNASRVLVGPPAPNATCVGCGVKFLANHPRRKFCTYACHLESGGAQRAGDAAIRARMKYGAKKDANHNAIFDEIRKHCSVHDTSNAGCGVPDGIAWVDGAWRLFDVKNPKTAYGRRGLNKRQTEWAEKSGGGPIYLLYTVEDAAKFGRGEFADLKCAGASE